MYRKLVEASCAERKKEKKKNKPICKLQIKDYEPWQE